MKDPWHFLIQLDYEEGAPKEIFKNPKKDKTRLFIHNLKEVHWSIQNRLSMFHLNIHRVRMIFILQ